MSWKKIFIDFEKGPNSKVVSTIIDVVTDTAMHQWLKSIQGYEPDLLWLDGEYMKVYYAWSAGEGHGCRLVVAVPH